MNASLEFSSTLSPKGSGKFLRPRSLSCLLAASALLAWSCSESNPAGSNYTAVISSAMTSASGGGPIPLATPGDGTTATRTGLEPASMGRIAKTSAVEVGTDATMIADGASNMTAAISTPTEGWAGTGGTFGEKEKNVDATCPFSSTNEPSGNDWIEGDLLEFNDNGGWCWYQDERAIVDREAGKLIIGSVASGGNRDAWVEVTHWDVASGQSERHHLGTMSYADDHDTPALVMKPDGGYVAMWAGHNEDCNSYYSVYDGDRWSNREAFAWPQCSTANGMRITYANIWLLDDYIHSYVRSIETSPHHLYSGDGGRSWKLGGRLTSTPRVGYVAGYYKYWGNNADRIDFFGTEAHPGNNDNSLYHGYIQDGAIHDSNGRVIDGNFMDSSAQSVVAYTTVFQTGTLINGIRLEHMWNADLVRYEDGTVAAIGTGRVTGTGSDDPDKRLLYFRFDGTRWTTTYLAKAGSKLYGSEQDYTGLGALDPDNPNIIYISTPYDPRTDEGDFDGNKEIWRGVTCDGGATFEWEPVTANSTTHNVRPVVPRWDKTHTALLWLRGTYSSAQSYKQQVVGLIWND